MELQKPSDEGTCQLLHGLAPKYEKHFNVKLAPGTVETDESESQHLNTKPVRSQVQARAEATAVDNTLHLAKKKRKWMDKPRWLKVVQHGLIKSDLI